MPDAITVSNSSCLIALESIHRLDLLRNLYGNLAVPEAVAAECGALIPSWIDVLPVQNHAQVRTLQLHLGAGESETIALAGEVSAQRVILDDKKARHIARQLKLPVSGTIAALLQAKQRGLISKVGEILDQLSVSGFFLSKALSDEARRLAGE